jgi:hypothetical protein
VNYNAGQPAAIALVTLELTPPPSRAGHSGSPSLDSLATQPSYLYTDDDHEVGPLESGKGAKPKSAGDNQGVTNEYSAVCTYKHSSNFESIAEVGRLADGRPPQ